MLNSELYGELELPKIYWDKKISKMTGATSPPFMCSFGSNFESEKSIEEAIQFHQKRFAIMKGVSLYVPCDKMWLVFILGKFHSIAKAQFNEEVTVGGVSFEQ